MRHLKSHSSWDEISDWKKSERYKISSVVPYKDREEVIRLENSTFFLPLRQLESFLFFNLQVEMVIRHSLLSHCEGLGYYFPSISVVPFHPVKSVRNSKQRKISNSQGQELVLSEFICLHSFTRLL